MSEEDLRDYVVVINHEEQYSVWFADVELPLGWDMVPIPDAWLSSRDAVSQENRKAKAVCLDYIAELWTDMRPLSLRKAMGG